MAWGIAETAPEKEKIKAEFADYIGGLNSCGVIDWITYSELYDFGVDLLDKMYNLGIADNKRDEENNNDERRSNKRNKDLDMPNAQKSQRQ